MIFAVLSLVVSALWIYALVSAARGVKRIPALRDVPKLTSAADELPRLSVIVPARNEGAGVRACLSSLAAQTYPNLEIIFVNDRSEDNTAREAEIALEGCRHAFQVLTIDELPDGWLGKCNALQMGANKATGEYLLFTDGDILFEATSLSRAMAYVREQKADMLVALPQLITKSVGERILISTFMRSFSLVFAPWRAADDNSAGFIGVGAFNLVRTKMYRQVGGHRFLRLQVIDDVGLGKIVKYSRGKVRVVFGSGMVSVRWYETVGQIVRGLEKNSFAGLGYSIPRALAGTFLMVLLNCWPWVGMFVGPAWARVLSGFVALVVQPLFGTGNRKTADFSAFYGYTAPIGSLFFAFILLRSMFITLRQGGIRWRDSFYPLKELRQFKI